MKMSNKNIPLIFTVEDFRKRVESDGIEQTLKDYKAGGFKLYEIIQDRGWFIRLFERERKLIFKQGDLEIYFNKSDNSFFLKYSGESKKLL